MFSQKFIRYINSFISHRNFYFLLHGQESPKINMYFGVLWCSSISPILFILYDADIPKPTTLNTYISQLADYIKTYAYSKSFPIIRKRLHTSITKIFSFCGERCISINEDKPFEFIFGKSSRRTIAEKLIQPSHSLTHLYQPKNPQSFSASSLIINSHSHNISPKQKPEHRISLRDTTNTYGLYNTAIIRLFKTFIRPLFEYDNIALITADQKHIKQWDVLQTKYIRKRLNKPYLSNVNT